MNKLEANRDTLLKAALGALWLVCLYRAVTQSVAHDEAYTYELYLDAPLSRIFTFFEPNHHFLNTLLMRLSVGIFGLSEWSLRLPALAGAAAYFAAVHQLAVRLIRSTLAAVLAVAILTLNPFVLDFMVAARGYGMALACYTWALVLLTLYARDRERIRLLYAGLALGLAVAANLVFVVPVAAMAAIAFFLLRPARETAAEPEAPASSKKQKRNRPSRRQQQVSNPLYAWFYAPLAGVGVALFLLAPLASARSGDLYAGAATVAESLRTIASAALAYGGAWNLGRWPAAIDVAAFALVPAALLAALAWGIRRRDPLLIFAAGAAVGSATLLVLAHLATGLLWPIDRTGIYFMMLVPVSLCALADTDRAAVRIPLAGLAAACVLLFAAQFQVRSFLTWKYDADTREIAQRLAKLAGNRAPDSTTIGASWQLEPSLNFYRDKLHLTWMRPVERAGLTVTADYFVLMAQDRRAIEAFGLHAVAEWPLSGNTLAVH